MSEEECALSYVSDEAATYECDACGTALPAGVVICPGCGEIFEEEVPADAVLPGHGVDSIALPSPFVFSNPQVVSAPKHLQALIRPKSRLDVKKSAEPLELTISPPPQLPPDLSALLEANPHLESGMTIEAAAETIKAMNGQMVVLKSEIILLKNHRADLVTEVTDLTATVTLLTSRLATVETGFREERRRFADHVDQMTNALHLLQYYIEREQ